MFHFQESIQNTKGDALIGFYAKVVDPASGSEVDIFADASSTPIVAVSGVDNAAKVDADGMADFYVESGTYHLDIYATDGTTRVKRILNHPMAEAGAGVPGPPGPPGSVDASALEGYVSQAADYVDQAGDILADIAAAPSSGLTLNATTRTLLAGMSTTKPAILLEAGREGTFSFVTADLSALVAADTAQGVYVAPSSDTTGASGAWVRSNLTYLRPEWFGAVADGSTDCLAAMTAMLAYIATENRNNGATGSTYRGARLCLFSSGAYYFSDTIDLKSTVRFQGYGSGGAGGASTILSFAADKCGIRVQRYNTTGENGAGTGTTGGDGSIIEGFLISGGGGSANLLHSGVWLRARACVRDCRIAGFAGVGTLVYASTSGSGAAYGNANGWELRNLRIEGCKYGGHYCTGGDANAGYAAMLDIANCGQYGLFDTCFLANTYVAVQVASCGFGTAAGLSQTSVVSDGTYRYQLVHGQDANAATTAPTTNGDNAVWKLQGTAGVSGSLIPLYSTYVAGGGSFVSGGSYYASNANANHRFYGCYHESGQADPWIDSPSVADGGTLGTAYNRGTGTRIAGTNGFMAAPAIGVYSTDKHSILSRVQLGELNVPTTVAFWSHTTYAPNTWRIGHGVGQSPINFPEDVWTTYSGGNPVERLTGPSTNEQFGTGTPQPFIRHISNLAIGVYNGSPRIVDNGTAAPTSGAFGAGHIRFNTTPAASGKASWMCTTGGWIATVAWTASHAYAVGALVTNDTGKSYLCTTAGTSASSGGPTGTGTSITDGTAVWKYSAGFAFVANYVNARADPTAGVGYVTGAGGSQSQATSRTTGVTLNKVCGQITLFSAAGSTSWQTFTVTNSTVAATDTVRVSQASGTDKYMVHVTGVRAGAFDITFATTAGTTTETPVFNFSVIKAVAA